jgi:2-oxoglutarate dehydrogenase E2 component (dihydrolipoamide succinyltransferase)
MGVSVAEGTVVAWQVSVGDPVKADQTVCEISTDKIDSEVPAPVAGVVSEILVGVEQTVPVGTVLARIAAVGAQPGEPTVSATAAAGTAPESVPGGEPHHNGHNGRRLHYSPVVERIAAEHGIDLSQVHGTGRGGRIRKQDVMEWLKQHDGSGAAGPAQGSAPQAPAEPPMHIESPYRAELNELPATAPSAAGPSSTLSRMRRSIGEHMKRSLETAATCTTWIEVDMGRVEAARKGRQITALSYVARACVLALREYPALNAWLEGERYTRFAGEVHLGIAVSLGEDGLIVPVVRNAHLLSVEGLAASIRELAGRARSGGLTPDEVRGGTFTITNPGQYGSIMATPVINQPQVAILDFEATVKRPVVLTDAEGNDSIAVRPITILGMSWDHRALDGVLSAQFLAAVKRHLESGSL